MNPHSSDWCTKTPDISGYSSNHDTGICMDVTGKGSRRDYCRVVTRGDDSFVACDLGSNGNYSYWFRSLTQERGFPVLDVPYAQVNPDTGLDSYCGVIPPTKTEPARAVCFDVKGTGFNPVPRDDPNPPRQARNRLLTYENLVCWFPLEYPSDSSDPVGAFKGKCTDIELRAEPPTSLSTAYPDRRGVKLWRGSPKMIPVPSVLPINETNCISLMIYPDGNEDNTSEQMVLYTGDGPYLNEYRITYLPTKNAVQLSVYDGKAFNLRIRAFKIKKDTWNHVCFQYKKGTWSAWTNGANHRHALGTRQVYAQRGQAYIGYSPEELPFSHFSGRIADLRMYSRCKSLFEIKAIAEDFHHAIYDGK